MGLGVTRRPGRVKPQTNETMQNPDHFLKNQGGREAWSHSLDLYMDSVDLFVCKYRTMRWFPKDCVRRVMFLGQSPGEW